MIVRKRAVFLTVLAHAACRLPIVVVALMLAAATGHAQDKKDLFGRWEPTMLGNGGTAALLEFRPDGTLLALGGTIARGMYTVDSVKITHSAPAREQPMIRGYEVKGDTLTVWSARHPTWHMVRTPGSQSRTGLVGEWAYAIGDRITIETFRADGTWRAWTQFAADSSRYSVRRNELTIRRGRMAENVTWRITYLGLDLQRSSNTGRGSTQTMSFVRERQ